MKAIWILPFAILVAGCSQQDQDKFQSDAKTAVKQTGQAAGSLTLEGKVNAVLRSMKKVDGSDFHVEVKDGVVTMTGSAKTAGQKQYILHTAEEVNGVDKVVDQMVVDGNAKP